MYVCLCNALTDRQVKQAVATAGTTDAFSAKGGAHRHRATARLRPRLSPNEIRDAHNEIPLTAQAPYKFRPTHASTVTNRAHRSSARIYGAVRPLFRRPPHRLFTLRSKIWPKMDRRGDWALLGPTHPTALSWLAAHWGITDRLRQVIVRDKPTTGRRLPQGHAVIGYGFFTLGETPQAAIDAIAARWPALRFRLVPRPAD
jgi:hypothetical protein